VGIDDIRVTFYPHADPDAFMGFYRDVRGFEVRRRRRGEGMWDHGAELVHIDQVG
jgi:hypothetical protein